MINVYPAAATDFSTLGVTTLSPASCTIEERAGGLFELEMTHPIDADLKWTYLQTGNIIKAPCAIREAPMLRVSDNISSGSSTKTRAIYKVTTDGRRLRLRAQPSESAKILHAYKLGTEVVRLSVSGNWANVVVCSNGQSGYMWAANLEFVRNETETVAADEEKPSAVVETQQTREQLFRIYSVAPDSASGMVTVKASHVFYDLKGIVCTKEYATENVAANEVLATILANLSAAHGFTFHCTVTAAISGDYSGVSVVRALLDPEIGIVPLTHAQIIRDNYDVYILPDTPMERGMEIRHRKNLIGAVLTTDASNVVTRIRPVGKDKDGNRLFITDNGGWVESANKALYPTSLDTEIEYDVTVSTDKDSKFKTDAEARAELKRLAEADFANGADAETVSLEVEFAALENTEEYEAYAKMQRLFLYDQVRVIAAYAGINAKLRVNGYVFDCLLKRYDDVYVGDISSLEQVTYGYEIASGTVSGAKLLPNSVNANTVMRRATIGYAKIAQAAIDQLSADSLTAQIAHINALTAGTIDADKLTAAWAKLYTIIAGQIEAGTVTADTLTAAMAKLTKASVEYADIDWANISKLTAAMANIATAKIGDADIDFAQIKQMKVGTAVADQLITHDAVADRYFIDKLQVRALQVLEQTVGSLTVKASDGNYYRLDIDPEAGTVVPTLVSLSDDEKAEGVTGDQSRCIIETDLTVADLAATNIKAINALIDKLTASRIEVDTLFAREAVTGALDSYLVRASTIEALEGQLNVWANEKVNLAVGALAIGGTNLIKGTRKMTASNWYGMTGTGKALVELDNDFAGEKIERSGLTSAAYTSCYAKTDNVITAGKAYILTADAYIDPSGTALDGNASLTLVFYSASGANLQSTAVRLSSESPTGTWQRLEVRTTAPNNAAYAQITMMLSKNGNVTFARLKLEEGNKATAWSPAPEDTDDSVNNLKSEIELVPGQISAAVSAVQVGGTNLVTLGNQSIVNASGSTAVYLGKDWYRASEYQTTVSPYDGVCWYSCPNIEIAAGRKYTLSYYAWIQPGATAGAVKFRPNLWGGTSETDKYLTDFIPFVVSTPTKYAVTFDTTGWTTGTYTLRFVMMEGQTHEVYFTDVKLEEGDKATAWSPNPAEVRIGASIRMDVNHTEINTPYLDIDVAGTDGDMHIDENGISAGTATFETVNCPDLVQYYTGPTSITLAAGADVKALSDALSNHMLTGNVTIGITGEVNGALELRGIGGYGRITINGGDNTLNGYINLYCNSVPIEINSVKVSRSTQRQCINVNNCTEVKTYACVFNANASSGNAQGFRSTYSGLFIQNCEFYNIPDSAMAFSYGTDALVLGCKGAATYCFWYDGATLRVAGSRPSGICAGGNPSFLLPSDPSTVTVDTGSATPAETPVTTASYTATTTGTYYPSGHWINDNIIRQGYEGTGSSARKDYGCMWFGASALSGKTIKSATLTIKRIAGKGRSSSVVMKLWTTTVTGKSGTMAASTLTSLGEIGKIANGETVTVSIPTSAISTIASGGGLALYTEETSNKTGKTYSENYAHFEGTDGSAPVLTVTYQ